MRAENHSLFEEARALGAQNQNLSHFFFLCPHATLSFMAQLQNWVVSVQRFGKVSPREPGSIMESTEKEFGKVTL